MRKYLFDLTAFGMTLYAALRSGWKTNELCWGLWISSLLTGWIVIAASFIKTVLIVTNVVKPKKEDYAPVRGKKVLFADYFVNKIPVENKPVSPCPPWKHLGIIIGMLAISGFVWFHFTFFHVVHGALMSFIVAIKPFADFGVNGFMDADPGEILSYLIFRFWPVILAVLIARRNNIFGGGPGKNMEAIYGTVIKIHIFIMVSLFLTVIVSKYGVVIYQRAALTLLLFLFFFPYKAARTRAVFE